jgi:hypothetical protein
MNNNIKKIAFCFLTYDIIIRYDVWNLFFQNIDEEKYSIFIHPKNINLYENLYEKFNLYKFKYNIVKNRINTKSKDHISVVQATLRLLEETYESDKNITHFIFLSQSCIPMYSFDKIYNATIQFPYSVISSIDNNKKDRYFQLSQKIKNIFNYKKFVKQQPNMILINEDLQFLLKNNYIYEFKNMECPDEHYFINILSGLHNKIIFKNQITFCNYDVQKTQALEFKIVNKDFIEYIRVGQFLFMRKVTKNSKIDIDYLLL